MIDPEQMVRDAVGVELPFSPLCRPDCQGLCPVCGGDRNLGECPGDHPSTDPRWAELEHVAPTDRGPRTDRDHDHGRNDHGRSEEEAEQVPSDKRAANWKASVPSYAECPQCKQPKLPHRVCGNCGHYAGRQAVEVE